MALAHLSVKVENPSTFFVFRYPNGEWASDRARFVNDPEFAACDRYIVTAASLNSAMRKAKTHFKSN
jgi:hypothetical protein